MPDAGYPLRRDERAAVDGFLRANPYYLEAPVNETANRFAGGLSYSLHDWNFFYRTGYQTFEQNMTLDKINGQEGVMEAYTAPPAPEPLTTAAVDSHCHLDLMEMPIETVIAEAQAVGVQRVVTIGIDVPSSEWSAAVASDSSICL